MSKDYGIDARSMLSQGFSDNTALWNVSEIDSIVSVFDTLQSGQYVSNNEIDLTMEQLLKGVGANASQTQSHQLIQVLYDLCSTSSPEQQARMLGYLVAPENHDFLQELFAQQGENTPMDPSVQNKLLEISKEANPTIRISMLVELVRQSSNAQGEPDLPDYRPMSERALPGNNDRQIKIDDQESKIEYSGQGGLEPEGQSLPTISAGNGGISLLASDLASAIVKNDAAAVNHILSGSMTDGNLQQAIAQLDPQTQESLKVMMRQLISDPEHRSTAYEIIQLLNLSGAAIQNGETKLSPLLNTNLIDTSQLESLLLSPDTLPATLGLLTKMGSKGQASLCQLLITS